MAGCGHHKVDDTVEARFGAALRRGVTLVELMVSMLLLAIICVAWFKIIAVQSARKEGRRREAVERLSGMMDAFMYVETNPSAGCYRMEVNEGALSFKETDSGVVNPVFDGDVSPVGYTLCVTNHPGWGTYDMSAWYADDTGNKTKWLVGRLYEGNGTEAESGRAFFSLPVLIIVGN